jgi:predicted mannosyl-3-phosphoglycerate phosphatase (HAD superfamily)
VQAMLLETGKGEEEMTEYSHNLDEDQHVFIAGDVAAYLHDRVQNLGGNAEDDAEVARILATELGKRYTVTRSTLRHLEKQCGLCGETYVAETEDEDHVVTEKGEYCGGKGEVTGEWRSQK